MPNPLNGLKNPWVIVIIAVSSMLSGGGGSYLTAYASDEKVKKLVEDSPAIVKLQADMEYVKEKVQANSDVNDKTADKVNDVDINLRLLMREMKVEPVKRGE